MTDAFAQLQELVVKQRCRDEASIMGVINENKDAFLSKKLDIDAPATQNVGNKSTLLHSAVWFRNKSVVDGLLSCRADPNFPNVKDNTPLHLACEKLPETKAIVEALVRAGGNRFRANSAGSFAIKIAKGERAWLLKLQTLSEEEADSKRDLLSKRRPESAQRSARNRDQVKRAGVIIDELTQLIVRKRCADAAAIEHILSSNRDTLLSAAALSADGQSGLNKPLGQGRSTLLHSAVWYMAEAVVKALLELRANPNALNIKNNTPLHLACEKLPGSEAIVELLVKAKGNRISKNAAGNSAAAICNRQAASKGSSWLMGLAPITPEEKELKEEYDMDQETRESLDKKKDDKTLAKADLLHGKLVELVIRKRCSDVKAVTTLLSKNRAMLLRANALIVDKAAGLNKPIGGGKSTLLHSAVWFKKSEVCKLLVELKASPNALNVKKNSPLHLACEKLPESKEIVEILVNNKGNRFLPNSEGSTPLSKAGSQRAWLQGIRPMNPEETESKIELDQKSQADGQQSAVKSERAQMERARKVYQELSMIIVKKRCADEARALELLRKNKGLFTGDGPRLKLDAPGNFGASGGKSNSTLLHSAVWFKNLAIVSALVDCGASPDAQNIKGNSPLHLACEKLPESKEIVELLVVKRNGNRYLRNSVGQSPLKNAPGNMRQWIVGLRDLDEYETKERQMTLEAKRAESANRSNLLDPRAMKRAETAFEELKQLIVKKRCSDRDSILALLAKEKELFCGSVRYKNIDEPLKANSTLLHSAVWFKQTDIVKQLVNCGASPNARNVKGNTPLHLACEKLPESKTIVEYLVLNKGNRFIRNVAGKSPMQCCPPELRQWLLDLRELNKAETVDKQQTAPGSSQAESLRKQRALERKWEAVYAELDANINKKLCKDVDTCLILLERALPLLVNAESPFNIDRPVFSSKDPSSGLMHSAVRAQKLPVVQKLVECGASPNSADIQGETPLHLACAGLPETKDIVKYLIVDASADRNFPNHAGKSPLDVIPLSKLKTWAIDLCAFGDDEIASEKKRRFLMSKLRERRRKHSDAVQRNKREKLEFQRRSLIDLIVKGYCRDTEYIEEILESTSFPEGMLDEPVNSSKHTMLHVAAKVAASPVIKNLLEAKATPNVLDLQKNNPLHLAVQRLPKGKVGVQALVLAGCNRYKLNKKKEAPSTSVPKKLRRWYQSITPMSATEKKAISSRQRNFQGLDVAMLRVRVASADQLKSGLLLPDQISSILEKEGLDAAEAKTHVAHYIRKHREEEKAVDYENFLKEFTRMKVFQTIVALGKKTVFNRADTVRMKGIIPEDFQKYLESQIGQEEGKRLSKTLFSKIDANHDGRLTISEVRFWYKKEMRRRAKE